MEKTLIIVKPDGVKRGLVGKIITRFENAGLSISSAKMLWLDKKKVNAFYPNDKEWILMLGKKNTEAARLRGEKLGRSEWEHGKLVRKWLMDYTASGPVVAVVLEGSDAIMAVRKLVGPTDCSQATPGTIRGDFSTDSILKAGKEKRVIYNLIHASGNTAEAKKEIKFFFSDKELR